MGTNSRAAERGLSLRAWTELVGRKGLVFYAAVVGGPDDRKLNIYDNIPQNINVILAALMICDDFKPQVSPAESRAGQAAPCPGGQDILMVSGLVPAAAPPRHRCPDWPPCCPHCTPPRWQAPGAAPGRAGGRRGGRGRAWAGRRPASRWRVPSSCVLRLVDGWILFAGYQARHPEARRLQQAVVHVLRLRTDLRRPIDEARQDAVRLRPRRERPR